MNLILAAGLAAALLGTPDDESALRAVVDRFFAAVAKKDADAVVALWSAEAPQLKVIPELVKASADPITGAKTDDFAIEGDSASATVRFKGKFLPFDAGYADEPQVVWRVRFVREKEVWKWSAVQPAAVTLIHALLATEEKTARLELLKGSRELVGTRLLRICNDAATDLGTSGEPEESRKLTTIAIEAAEFSGRKDLLATAYLTAGMLLATQAKPGESLPFLEKARTFADEANDNESACWARAWIGFSLMDTNRPDEALVELQRAIDLAEKHKLFEEWSHALKFAGMAHARKGSLQEALACHKKAADLALKADLPDARLQVLHELGNVQWQLGDYGGALETTMAGLQLAEGPDAAPVRAKLLNSMGLIYLSSGEYARAVDQFKAALDLWTTLKLPRMTGSLLNNMGEALRQLGRLPEAKERLEEAFKILEETGDRAVLIAARNNLALVLRMQEDLDGALKQYRLCLSEAKETRNPTFAVAARCNIADILTIRGKFEEALAELKEADALAKTSGSAPDRFMVKISVAQTAIIHGAPEDLEHAVKVLRQAATLLESARGGLRDPALQQSFLAQHSPVFYLLASSLHNLKRDTEAFAASEEAKARTLMDLFGAGGHRITKSMTPAERTEEERLEAELRKLGRKLDETVLSDERQTVEEAITKVREGVEDFRRGIFARHPELQGLRGRFEAASLDELHRKLLSGTPKTAVLSYVLGSSEVLLFAVGPGKESAELVVHSIDIKQANLREKVEAFWAKCSQAGSDYAPAARELFQLLIAPAEKLLSGVEHVVIVPDGLLHGLPFQALQDRDNRHLVERWSVSFAPSATALLRMTEAATVRRAAAGGDLAPFLAVGAPVMPPGFAELDHAKKEVENLAAKYKVPAVSGPDATETRIKPAMQNARRIHIATHGKVDENAPLYSFIVLGRDESNDGLLHAREIMDLNLRAELVVLSACETALGKQVRGEGIVGLTWSLFAAGTPATVLSQWQVADESTGDLMKAFYDGLSSGVPFAKSLQVAQRRLLEDKRRAHPYFWAPFILVGAGGG